MLILKLLTVVSDIRVIINISALGMQYFLDFGKFGMMLKQSMSLI